LSEQDNPEQYLHLTLLEHRVSDIVCTKLSERCREVFLLSRVEGMPNSEIAERLGVSVKTVENQMTRALKILRQHLRRHIQEG
jgi:RNA polymerase sigma factor (sigma-70 family)